MGLVLMLMWLVALAVTVAPGVGLAGVIVGISRRTAAFFVCGLLALLASVAAEYAVVLQPYLEKRTYGIELMLAPILNYYLAVPALLAAIVWFALKARQKPALAGMTAGLLLSIPVVVALALPVAFWAPEHLHLRFVP